MPRHAHKPIDDLSSYSGLTVSVSQAATYLGMATRDVCALVRSGVLAKQARGTREYHIFADSLRAFDDLRFKRSA